MKRLKKQKEEENDEFEKEQGYNPFSQSRKSEKTTVKDGNPGEEI